MTPPFGLSLPALERDTDVEYVNTGGPGGQHRNKTETGVRLRHRPTGVVVSATERRSRTQNLSTAFDRLRRRLVLLMTPPPPRVATRPSRAAKKRRIESKRHAGDKKRMRGRVEPDD
jgi:protein subunit release factor B